MEMTGSAGVGFMTVCAISGSVVFVALQVHKHLLSDFMKKVESELSGPEIYRSKKKVRFTDDVLEPSSNNKEYRIRRSRLVIPIDDEVQTIQELGMGMPPNRRALYKGIIEYRMLKGHADSYVYNKIRI